MGLDNFWTPNGAEWDSEPTITIDFDPPLHLGPNGDLFNDGWFRGKRYAPLIQSVTGISIYNRILPNYIVHGMARELEAGSYEEAIHRYQTKPVVKPVVTHKPEISQQEYNDLRRMFRAYADAGAQLESWY